MKYSKKPEKIKLKKSESKYCVCNNCFDTNYVYKITLNETNFETPKGNIGKNPYAKKYELWLCKKCLKELYKAIIDDSLELNEKPFRWGGISKKFEKTSRQWQNESKDSNNCYKTCYCCKKNTPLDEPLYCAGFETIDNKFCFKILCRNCAYKYGVGVIESDGKIYQNYEDFKKNDDKNNKEDVYEL